jgi:hypothetical protein
MTTKEFDYIARTTCPLIGIKSSEKADLLMRKNNLSLQDFLSPFGLNLKEIEVPGLTLKLKPYLRFKNMENLEESEAVYKDVGHSLVKESSDFAKFNRNFVWNCEHIGVSEHEYFNHPVVGKVDFD